MKKIRDNFWFINWYYDTLKEYDDVSILEFSKMLEKIQSLIDKITMWYEIKIPDKYFENVSSLLQMVKHKKNSELSEYMDFDELMYRLTDYELSLLCVYYICNCGYCNDSDFKNYVSLNVKKEIIDSSEKFVPEHVSVYFNSIDGLVDKDSLAKFNIDKEINISELYDVLKEKYSDILEFDNIERIINIHKFDLELRKVILWFVAFNLIYFDRHCVENGFYKAFEFIKEFNENIADLNLEFNFTKEEMELARKDWGKAKELSKKFNN